jgi:hypothetical protein
VLTITDEEQPQQRQDAAKDPHKHSPRVNHLQLYSNTRVQEMQYRRGTAM